MHELSIAQSIVDLVLYEADKNRAETVAEVHIEVGEITQVDSGVLRKALDALMTGQRLTGAKVCVRIEKAKFSCNRCGSEWDMTDAKKQLAGIPDSLLIREPDSDELPTHFLPNLYAAFIRCPTCGSSDFSALGGDDIRVMRVILE